MGIRIHHLGAKARDKTHVFEGERVSLGRRAGHDVQFDPEVDRTVSADHAEIVFVNGSWVFRDMGSANGSWMDGSRVEEVMLKGGEKFEFGIGGPVVRVELDNGERSLVQTPNNKSRSKSNQGPVGAKTVGKMIDAAIAEAHNERPAKIARTSFIRSVAKEAARRGSRRFKIVVGLIIFGLAGVVAFLIVELRQTRDELREVEAAKMGPSEIGEAIAVENRRSIYLLIYRTRTGFEQGFCTGFAVSQNELMTNAHCIVQIEKLAEEGSVFFAAPNEGKGVRYSLVKWRSHPEYDQGSPWPTPDVGKVTVNGKLPYVVPIADAEHLKRLRSGAQIFVYGFPGDLSDVSSPVATITGGMVGRMTTFNGIAAAPEGRPLLQYSAFTSKGTSGSPVFDKYRRVIAVNSGYYQGKSRVTIEDPATGKSEQANVSRDLSGYSFGIRVDIAHGIPR